MRGSSAQRAREVVAGGAAEADEVAARKRARHGLALCGRRDADGILQLWTLPIVGWGLIERHDEAEDTTARSVLGMVAPPMESYELHVANRVRGFLDTYV